MAQLASELEHSEKLGPRLRGLAFRLLGSLRETDVVVRRATEQADPDTDVVLARMCLDALSLRSATPRDDWHVPDLVVSPAERHTPEQLELLAGSVGSALHVALDTLPPEERVALVLRDGYGMALDRIADVIGLPEQEVDTLADRARDAFGSPVEPDGDLQSQRALVTAFFRATRAGDHEAVMSMLHPDSVLHADAGDHAISAVVHGAEQMARRAVLLGRVPSTSHPVLVNNAAGSVVTAKVPLVAVLAFTVVDGRVAQIDEVAEPSRVAALGVHAFVDA